MHRPGRPRRERRRREQGPGAPHAEGIGCRACSGIETGQARPDKAPQPGVGPRVARARAQPAPPTAVTFLARNLTSLPAPYRSKSSFVTTSSFFLLRPASPQRTVPWHVTGPSGGGGLQGATSPTIPGLHHYCGGSPRHVPRCCLTGVAPGPRAPCMCWPGAPRQTVLHAWDGAGCECPAHSGTRTGRRRAWSPGSMRTSVARGSPNNDIQGSDPGGIGGRHGSR